jgi:hypothetical protein
MLRQLARWLPTVLLVVLVAIGLGTGAGVEPFAVAALLALQVAIVGLPRVAEAAGRWYGERTSE